VKGTRVLATDVDRRQVVLVVLAIAISFAAGSVLTGRYLWFLRDVDAIKEFVLGFGAFAPAGFVAIQILQVVVAPIPGQVLAFAAGYLFGAGLGFVYSMFGATAGTYLAVLLARRYGRPYVERIVDPDLLASFDGVIADRGIVGLFLVFLLPGFPDDVICFVAGMSELDVRKLVLVSILGRTPGYVVLALSGAGVAQDHVTESLLLLSGAGVVALVLYWRRERILQYVTG
jgi:uncharacterized membrane protein YdjX (TVP38/TMEM64 family)